MGRIIASILLILFALQLQGSPKRVALIVAIGDYPSELGWRKLSSANDVVLIKNALIYQGFKEENIKVIKDREATKKGVLSAINDLSRNAEKGSIVFFHYSGHGQQIVDEVGDEVDGLDESLIPYDAGLTYELCAAKGGNHIRDDLLGELFTKIRKKIGTDGDIIVSLDACHSGTATRGIGVARGTDKIFSPPNRKPDPSIVSSFNRVFLGVKKQSDLAPMVVISGSSSTELNYEYFKNGKSYGSLSFALSKALHELGSNFTYRALFGRISAIMSSIAPRQSPQLEGDVDRHIFSGTAVEQAKFTTVRLWQDATKVSLNAGQLNGVTNNSVVEFYPIGTTDLNSVNTLSVGKVVNAQLAEALVTLEKPLSKEQSGNSWVFIKEVGFSTEKLRINISENLSSGLSKELNNVIKQLQFVELGKVSPDILIEMAENDKNTLKAISKNDKLIYSRGINELDREAVVKDLVGSLKLYAQAKLLRTLESENSRFRVIFELVPVMLNESFEEIQRLSISSKVNRSGQLVFNKGDFFRVRITNQGDRTAFYSLISIQPDNAISILVPEKDANGNPFRAPSDCRIEPGKSEELRAVFYIKEPYGQEVFKLISANRPLQLDQLVKTRGAVIDSGSLHPFEAIFADSFDLLTRSNNYRLPPELIHIHTLVLKIMP